MTTLIKIKPIIATKMNKTILPNPDVKNFVIVSIKLLKPATKLSHPAVDNKDNIGTPPLKYLCLYCSTKFVYFQ